MNRANILSLLDKYSIPYKTEWGTGEAKTLEHLITEITEGECELVETNGILIRQVRSVNIDIFYRDGKQLMYLYEEKQVFKDGRERVRKLQHSLGGKRKHSENPKFTAIREIKEELGFKLNPDYSSEGTKGPVESQSYPGGISSFYIFHVYEAYVPSRLFNPDGYIEEQEDKTSYFKWKKSFRQL